MNPRSLVYLDNNATTPVDPAVRDVMLPFLGEEFGNPSSPYSLARGAAAALARAREQVARLIEASPDEIVFTGCGTESNNAAIRAMMLGNPGRRHLVVTQVEHSSVLNFVKHLEEMGFSVTRLAVDRNGQIDLGDLTRAVTKETCGVSIMAANNETGIMLPVKEAAAIAHAAGALFHTDAVQAVGKIPLSSRALGMDYLSLSGHKFHAAKGVGALYVRAGAPFSPYIVGGDQESGRRGGTENVAGIAGLGRAAELAREQLTLAADRVQRLRDKLEAAVTSNVKGVSVVGRNVARLPNTACFLIEGVEAEALLALLDMDGICCSSGSACASGAPEPSHVLRAMGLQDGSAPLRVSLSRFSTDVDVERMIDGVVRSVEKLRKAR
jgi:cysteine desulfurase